MDSVNHAYVMKSQRALCIPKLRGVFWLTIHTDVLRGGHILRIEETSHWGPSQTSPLASLHLVGPDLYPL